MDTIFSQPLPQRIDSLTRWIDECTNKELLPVLVDNIFGETNGVGWGLRIIQYNTYPMEYDLLYKFLHPHGPVFRLCYKLLSDTYLKYDYQLNYLPVKLKRLIEEGIAPSFYMDKVQYDHKTRQPIFLSLNPFEYYMFHFVFHMVNPWLEMNSHESNLNLHWQTLYMKLAEQYLLMFLPLDGSPVLPLTTHYMVQSQSRSLPIHTPNKPARTSTLFRENVLMKHTSTVHSATQTAPHLEIWRSQLIVQLCIEFWLSVPSADNMWFCRPQQPSPRSYHPYLHERQPVSPQCIPCLYTRWPKYPHPYLHQEQNFAQMHGSLTPESQRICSCYPKPNLYQRHSCPMSPTPKPQRIYPCYPQPNLYRTHPCPNSWYNQPNQPWSSPSSPQYKQQQSPNAGANQNWFNRSIQSWSPPPTPYLNERQPVNISSQYMPSLWPQQSLPTGEHLRVVRFLIKHLHYFANSQVEDSSAMNELKRIIIPSSQNKIYQFLRETMQHWPLDASFRLILETWLSYIQPWRYTDCRTSQYQEGEERISIVDQRWLPFIAENLLAYTYVFQQLLSRFSRLDLSTPRNALMLFRVSKIFAQPNLNVHLKEIEKSLAEEGKIGSSKDWCSIVKTQISELEGPGFQYSPLFSEKVKSQVLNFLELIQQAETVSRSRLDSELESRSLYSNSILRFFFSNQLDAEYSYDERKKVPVFLESSLYNLSAMFNLDVSSIQEANVTFTNNTSLNQSCLEQTPVEMRRRIREMKYQGDPDLKPIQSFEVACFVRLLYHVASWINFVYGREIRDLYTRNNLVGGMARQIFWGPTTIFYFDKSVPGYSPRVSTTLPPRLSLRYWANHRLLGLILIASMLAKFMFGIPVVLAWLIVLFFWIIYLLCNALLGRVPPIPNLNDVHDISMFNSTFN